MMWGEAEAICVQTISRGGCRMQGRGGTRLFCRRRINPPVVIEPRDIGDRAQEVYLFQGID